MSDRKALINGLISDPEHRARYLDNAWFRMSVDQLAEFLPLLVEGLARQSDEKDAEMQEQVRRMKMTLAPGVIAPRSLGEPK